MICVAYTVVESDIIAQLNSINPDRLTMPYARINSLDWLVIDTQSVAFSLVMLFSQMNTAVLLFT